MRPLRWLIFWALLGTLLCAATVTHVPIKGTVSPAQSDYLKKALLHAQNSGSALLLIELDTPGGLYSATREMVQMITNAPLPVCIYVSPKGAHAASAGTFLLYAAHIAAMAPGTNIGAATPISLMPFPGVAEANATAETPMKKALNDAMATIQSLAELNDRNLTWAIRAVRDADSISAETALKLGVINLIAENRTQLLEKLEGVRVTVGGNSRILHLQNAVVDTFEADWKTSLLITITDPNIAYIFLLLAIYGIFFELMNPGGIVPGVIGALSGVVALYALGTLPFNYAGLALIFLGAAFMVAEVFVAGFGILGIGGVVAFVFGSLLLFDAQTLGTGVSLPLVIAFALVSLGFFLLLVRFLFRARSQRAQGGAEAMIGTEAEVVEVLGDGHYRVRSHGELWQAKSAAVLHPGDTARIETIEGLTLHLTSH
jgi:membrane-bound serine protease (ClpP class)